MLSNKMKVSCRAAFLFLTVVLQPSMANASAGENTNLTDYQELSVRWYIDEGGPNSIEKVKEILSLGNEKGKVKKYDITYYEQLKAPENFTNLELIARQRINEKGNSEWMVKWRQNLPFTNIDLWNCPLPKGTPKYEADITYQNIEKNLTAYSLSCDSEDKEAKLYFDKYLATQNTVKKTMLREKIDNLKLDLWTEADPKNSLIEVSMSIQSNDNASKEKFYSFVKLLIANNIKPITKAKSQ